MMQRTKVFGMGFLSSWPGVFLPVLLYFNISWSDMVDLKAPLTTSPTFADP